MPPAPALVYSRGVIAAQARNPGGSLIVMPDPFNRRNRDLIIALAARYGVPAIYYNRALAESGGLIAYSDDFAEELRQAAGYIDRILRGSKVGSRFSTTTWPGLLWPRPTATAAP